jgi:signal transduction histidine kinase
MSPPSQQQQIADATGVLVRLQARAESVRAELQDLQQDLAHAERELSAAQGPAQLRANEHLVASAARAQAIAHAARNSVTEMVRSISSAVHAGAPQCPEAERAEHERQVRDLRADNEQLVLAALEAKEMEATAQAAYHRQVAFLATVAHELRNPLMPLRLAAHMLSRARMDEAVHAKLQATITGQVGQITRLINDLLDGSRISTGKFRLERTVVELSGIVDLAIETCLPAMDARNHRFKFIMPPQPIKVLGDSVRLAQILGNLLGNAAKYTPEGGEISLQATVLPDTVSITVSDNGIGISAPALPHVFDLFVQDARATVISPGGLGIGLAVVRELVKAHEGTVVAKSAGPDLGSQFVVTLPLARREAAPAAAA